MDDRSSNSSRWMTPKGHIIKSIIYKLWSMKSLVSLLVDNRIQRNLLSIEHCRWLLRLKRQGKQKYMWIQWRIDLFLDKSRNITKIIEFPLFDHSHTELKKLLRWAHIFPSVYCTACLYVTVTQPLVGTAWVHVGRVGRTICTLGHKKM